MTQKPPSVNVGASDEITATGPREGDDGAGGPSGEPAEAGIREERPEEAKAAAESYDDSLEAILLQASARPPEPAASKMLGSKTLMGIGIEALNLSAILASAKARGEGRTDGKSEEHAGGDDESAAESAPASQPGVVTRGETAADASAGGNDESPIEAAGSPTFLVADPSAVAGGAKAEDLAKTEAKLAATIPSGEKETSSLLDEVAQALNVQASEYRDRARGRLPGMPSANLGGNAAAFSKAGAARTDVEFEDPDDGPTALTPGVISVVEEHDEEADVELGAHDGHDGIDGIEADDADADDEADDVADADAADESVVLGPSAFGNAVPARMMAKADSRSGPIPPLPGQSASPASGASGPSGGSGGSGGSTAPVGPPPGVPARPATPSAGLPSLSSGRVHLPTPMGGITVATLPAPGVGRLTLPLGAPTPVLGARVDSDLTATSPSTPISLEASRRVAAGLSAAPSSGQVSAGSGRVSAGSGRVAGRGSGRITEPVLRAVSAMPAVLTAHVKLATISLTGLIAVTFAGGLLVGMLLWRGQGPGPGPGRSEVTTARGATTPTPGPAQAATAPPSPAAPAGETAAAHAAANQPATGAQNSPSAIENQPVGGTPAPAVSDPAGLPTEAIVTPLGGVSEAPAAMTLDSTPVPKPARRAPRPPRAKPAVVTVAADPAPSPKTVAPKPVIRAAASSASKPMATNAGTKPAVAKSKAKPAWHDPFAD